MGSVTRTVLVALVAVLLPACAPKPPAADQTEGKPPPAPAGGLVEEIGDMDRVVFDAFNRKDLETLKGVFAEDLEFYHDKDGQSGYEKTIASLKALFDGPVASRRELVAGSVEVYPMQGDRAVQTGAHRFHVTEAGQPEKPGATAKFIHLWQKRDGKWKIARVISYDHR